MIKINPIYEKMKINQLRESFKKYNIDGYLIASTDEYQNEYSPKSSKRLEYITGFSGSNGYALIMRDKAYLFTDSRYLLQAEKQLPDFFEILDLRNLQDFKLEGKKIGYNTMVFSKNQIKAYFSKLTLVEIEGDLVDNIWENKPENRKSEAYIYDIKYAGKTVLEKLDQLRAEIKSHYLFITDPTSICWLLNIRASDIDFCPIMLGRILVSKEEILLFTNLDRISGNVRSHLDFVTFIDENDLSIYLSKIANQIMIDPSSCSIGLSNIIKNKIEVQNPCQILQMQKNQIEINNAKEVHIKDAVALIEALAWVCEQHKEKSIMTEYDIAKKLSYYRSLQDGYVMDSFPSIVGFRENGAIIHYRPEEYRSKKIEGEGALLIDSGGHYLGGTTDVTRNLYFGKPSNEIKRRYTEVLKGHINLNLQKFPISASGSHLDVLARMFLWQEGLDYGHGTGHGVGNCLSVHEGSVISPRPTIATMKAGIILSNEPGFYKNGEYGIRIENLLYVKDSGPGFLSFENLTLVPYCHSLIDFTFINKRELEYLINYNDIIKSKIGPLLSDKAKDWLDGEIGFII